MFNITEIENDMQNKLLTNDPVDTEFRATVTYFKESGKYYTETELVIPVDENTNNYDIMNAIVEYLKTNKGYRGMTAVVTTPDNQNFGYPMLVSFEERK